MVKPKKYLGQHFLKEISYAERTAAITKEYQELPWLEIGPGTGVLSRCLEQTGTKFKAVELDGESVDYLQQEHPSYEVIQGDFLQLSVDQIYSEPFGVIGNFPYNISSQIVFKVLEHHDQIPVFAGMFQLEVAERLASEPNSKKYGITSVLTQAYYDIEILFRIPPGAFNPPPKVQSAVIRAVRHGRDVPTDEMLLRDVVKSAFQQRRKTLRNALRKFNLGGVESNHAHLLKLRAENLTVQDFFILTEAIRTKMS